MHHPSNNEAKARERAWKDRRARRHSMDGKAYKCGMQTKSHSRKIACIAYCTQSLFHLFSWLLSRYQKAFCHFSLHRSGFVCARSAKSRAHCGCRMMTTSERHFNFMTWQSPVCFKGDYSCVLPSDGNFICTSTLSRDFRRTNYHNKKRESSPEMTRSCRGFLLVNWTVTGPSVTLPRCFLHSHVLPRIANANVGNM